MDESFSWFDGILGILKFLSHFGQGNIKYIKIVNTYNNMIVSVLAGSCTFVLGLVKSYHKPVHFKYDYAANVRKKGPYINSKITFLSTCRVEGLKNPDCGYLLI